MKNIDVNKIILFLIVPLLIASIAFNVNAATSQETNTNVFVINSPPTAGAINITPDPAEPGDIMTFKINVSDVNGVPGDISSVNGTLDMGTPGDGGDDVTITFSYNAGSGLYENTAYQIPLNAEFGTWTINITVVDSFSASDSNTATFTVADLTDPVINSVNAAPNPVDPGNTINITANITDNVNVDTIIVDIDGVNYTMTYSGSGDVWYYDQWDTLVTAGMYYYTVYANDTSGNNATSMDGNFTVSTLIAVTLSNTPIDFGNTTIPVTERRADNGTAGDGYSGGTIKGFPLVVNNVGNVNENFTIAGTNMTGQTDSGYEIDVSNISYDTDSDVSGASSLSTSATTFASSVAMSGTQNVYFWLTIPSGYISQDYQGTVNITAVQS